MEKPKETQDVEQVRGEKLREKMIESEEYGEKFRAGHQGADARETKVKNKGGKNA